MRLALAVALVTAMSGTQIERAQQVARSRESERAQFHARYLFTPRHDTVVQIEVVTEFRRLVLITEQHLFAGDQMFSRGLREAQQALAPTKGVMTLKAQLRFHPQNAYVTVPDFKIALGRTPAGPLSSLLDTHITGDFATQPKNSKQNAPVTGATLEAKIDTMQIGQAALPIGVVLEDKELARTVVDFARLD